METGAEAAVWRLAEESESSDGDSRSLLQPSRASRRIRSLSHSRPASRSESPMMIFSKEELDNLAEAIAQKVFNKKGEKEDREKVEAERKAGSWEEGTEWLVCKPCSAHSNTPDVPLVFRPATQRGLHYGMINKKVPDGRQTKVAAELCNL